MVTSGFHLWQFQVFNCWCRGIGGGILLDWTCERFSFIPHWVFELGTSESLFLHSSYCTMVTSGFHLWQFEVFNSGAEGSLVVLFWLDVWEIFILPILELWNQGPLDFYVLHSTTVPWWLLVFTSDHLRYLTLVQRDHWWYSSDWTCERFSFIPHWVFNWGPLDLQSCTLPLHNGDFWFSPLTIWGILLRGRGIGGGIVLIWTCERFSFSHSYWGLNWEPLDL